MNTKIPEKQKQVNAARSELRDVARFPGKVYFLILITTVVLLIAFLISFVVVFFRTNSGSGVFNDPDFDSGSQEIDTSSKSVGGNLPGRTVAKRSSYISKTDQKVDYLPSSINSSNAILIDVLLDRCVAFLFRG